MPEHDNTATPQPDLRGQGSTSTLAAELATPARRRSTARMLEAAIDHLPLVTDDPDFWAPILDALAAGARDSRDPRGRAACARVLATLRAQQLDAIQALDKLDRLDSGEPTERTAVDATVRIDVRDPAQRNRLAAILAHQPTFHTNGGSNGNGDH